MTIERQIVLRTKLTVLRVILGVLIFSFAVPLMLEWMAINHPVAHVNGKPISWAHWAQLPGAIAATNCNAASGSSESTIGSMLAAASTNSCTGTSSASLVQLAVNGNYTWTGKMTLPCGSTAWTLSGPVGAVQSMTVGGYTVYATSPSATVTSNGFAGDQAFYYPSGCTTGMTLQWFEYDGQRPAAGGGGFLNTGQGASYWNIEYVYAHGFQAVQYVYPNASMSFVYMSGCSPVNSGCSTPPVQSHINVLWNRIGDSDAGDCSAVMQEYQYVPSNKAADNYGNNAGGYCGTFGIDSYTSYLTISNNFWFHIEQAGKCYESDGNSPYYAFLQSYFVFSRNTIIGNHRIAFEGQCSPVAGSGTMAFDNNAILTPYYTGYASWMLSLPQSGGSPGSGGGATNHTNNVLLADVAIPTIAATYANCEQYAPAWNSGTTYSGDGKAGDGSAVTSGGVGYYFIYNGSESGQPLSNTTYWRSGCYSGANTGGYFLPPAIEFWGPGTVAHNLIQSAISSGISRIAAPGCETSAGSINYNTFQSVNYAGLYTGNEQCGSAAPPTTAGNVTGTTPAVQLSVPPTISPTPSGSYSSNITVTITDAGYTSGTSTLPMGNHSIFYTLDGSTPTTSSTICSSPCVLSVSPGSTVSAIGMWGDLNQPHNWPSGMGFSPSSKVSATYASGGGTVTLSSVTLVNTGAGTSFVPGQTNQFNATCYYSDASNDDCTNVDSHGNDAGFFSSNTATGTMSANGLFTAIAAGTTSVSARVNSTTATPTFTMTVQGVLMGKPIGWRGWIR